ncbi:MAG: hypothetical protein AAFQ83_24350 [Bacteroidota bacterium]
MQKLKSQFKFIKRALFFFSMMGIGFALLPAQSIEYVSGGSSFSSGGFFDQDYDIFQINADDNDVDATLRLKTGNGSGANIWAIFNDKESRDLSFNQVYLSTGDNDVSRVGYKRMLLTDGGNLGLGDDIFTTPDRTLHIQGTDAGIRLDRDAPGGSTSVILTRWAAGFSSIYSSWQFGLNAGPSWSEFFIGDWGTSVRGGSVDYRMKLKSTGLVEIPGTLTVGSDIGTNNPFTLAVDGTIGCKMGVKVIPDGDNFPSAWPDYVFAEDYAMKDLSEVEAFIKENKHLPDVPSEEEVNQEGIELVEMNATLLKKIEELTLYVIDQNKQIMAQNARIEALEQSRSRRKRK